MAAQQPGPAAYRYTRALDRFVSGVNAADGEQGRVTEQQTSENWTSDGWRGRTTAARGSATWARRRAPRCRRRRGDIGAVVKPYDGDYRYGDGPLARVPFDAIPDDAAAAGALLEAAIRDMRWGPDPNSHPHWAPGVVDSEVARSAVLLLSMGNLDEQPARGAVRAARQPPGRPLARRGHRRDRAQGRRRRAAPARLRRRAARDHRPRDERHPAELGGHAPRPRRRRPKAPRGRAKAAALASAGLAGRAHPGLPEHGQRRRARGPAVGRSSAGARGAARRQQHHRGEGAAASAGREPPNCRAGPNRAPG